jgi:hypothetical protein
MMGASGIQFTLRMMQDVCSGGCITAVRMIHVDRISQGIQELFRAVQWVDVRLGSVIMEHFERIKHDGGDAKKARFLADCMTFVVSDGMAYNHAADMSGGQYLNGGISRGNRYDAVSGMRQNRIANRRQHLLPGKGKDSWSHIVSVEPELSSV